MTNTTLNRQFFTITFTSLVTLLLLFTSCSTIFPRAANPEQKVIVIRVAEEYLRNIVQGRKPQIDGMILWSEYLSNKDPKVFSKDQLWKQLEFFKKFQSADQHPLFNLDVVLVSVNEDAATVVLKKSKQEDAPEIAISLTWVGQGWLITDDSIFGTDGIVALLLEETK